jgi:hypothetical protein
MHINPCVKCGNSPVMISNSAIEYDDIKDGKIVEHHFHDMPISYLECACGPTICHPVSDWDILVGDWNTKNPAPPPDDPSLLTASGMLIANKV